MKLLGVGFRFLFVCNFRIFGGALDEFIRHIQIPINVEHILYEEKSEYARAERN